MTFLSTPSARRATRSCTGRAAHRPFLSTPSARRATVALCHLVFSFGISIHALREEGDSAVKWTLQESSLFLSTPSARRETGRLCPCATPSLYFYPRPPRGGRPSRICPRCSMTLYFYPRPPRGGRHFHQLTHGQIQVISIHALREEGDLRRQHPVPSHMRFLSTPSARRATIDFLCRLAP